MIFLLIFTKLSLDPQRNKNFYNVTIQTAYNKNSSIYNIKHWTCSSISVEIMVLFCVLLAKDWIKRININFREVVVYSYKIPMHCSTATSFITRCSTAQNCRGNEKHCLAHKKLKTQINAKLYRQNTPEIQNVTKHKNQIRKITFSFKNLTFEDFTTFKSNNHKAG